MSILNQQINLEKPVTLTILKRGGGDNYKNGKIVVETDKAILVQFEEEKLECWISKRNVWNNELDYGIKSKMWNAWERVKMVPINSTGNECVSSTLEIDAPC